jgi:hypothetical protein
MRLVANKLATLARKKDSFALEKRKTQPKSLESM